jgi:hypothetical protein
MKRQKMLALSRHGLYTSGEELKLMALRKTLLKNGFSSGLVAMQ